MTSDAPGATRVLIVAHKTAATPALLHAVKRRAAQGPCAFTLVVPAPKHGLDRASSADDDASEGEQILALALPLLEEAAGAPVEGIVGDAEPISAVADAVNDRGFDEIIVSTLPKRVSRWMRMDLPAKIGGLGLPVTTVTARG